MQPAPVFVEGRLSPRGLEMLRRFFAAFYTVCARMTINGRENVPGSGGFVLATSHFSRFDVPLLFVALPGVRWVIFAADKYYQKPFFRWLVESVDCLWVKRGETSHATVVAAIQALRQGRALGLAPEGTRSKTGTLQLGKPGAAFIAMTAGVPIVPVAIAGTEQLAAALKRMKRVQLTVTFGSPFTIATPPLGEQMHRKQVLEAGTTEIMCRIAAMLPPPQRGVYAEHPRVRELAATPQNIGGTYP
jgi:1-acyl-sn-glycerol-3-phosphate acyltransferase